MTKKSRFTRGRATRILLMQWLASGALVSAVVTVQSVLGKYGDDSGLAWTWLASILIPPLSILVTAALTESSIGWHDARADLFKFRLAFALGAVCVIVMLLVIFAEPFLSVSYFELFEKTGLALALWQGFAVAAIGAVIFEGR